MTCFVDSSKPLHVVAGVLLRSCGELLLAQRHGTDLLAGLWEFPGGKLDAGESRRDALDRELSEELGIAVLDATPFQCFEHQYADKAIMLDVWWVERWSREPYGREGQRVTWIDLSRPLEMPLAPADQRVFDALRNAKPSLQK
jgi:8-oxo-dGTP diphosphatase